MNSGTKFHRLVANSISLIRSVPTWLQLGSVGVVFVVLIVGLGFTLTRQFQQQTEFSESGFVVSIRPMAEIDREILRLNLLIGKTVESDAIALQRALLQSRINIFKEDVVAKSIPKEIEAEFVVLETGWIALTPWLDAWEADPGDVATHAYIDESLAALEVVVNGMVIDYNAFSFASATALTRASQRWLTQLGLAGAAFFVFVLLAAFYAYKTIKEREQAQAALQDALDNLELTVSDRTRELQEINHRLEIQYQRQAALAEIELAINDRKELQTVLKQIVQLTTALLPETGSTSVILWDAAEDKFQLSASSITQQPENFATKRVRKSSGATRWIVENRKPISISDIRDDPFTPSTMLIEHKIQAYLGLPLLAEDEVLGVFYAMDSQAHEYSTDETKFLQSMANRAAAAIMKVRLFEDMQDAKNIAEAANSAKSDFLSRMSHELRTPMNSILGFSQLLDMSQKEPLTSTQQSRVEQIMKAANHLLGLIDEMLEISRIEAGRLDISLEPMDIAQVLAQVLDMTTSLAAARDIKLHLESTFNQPVFIKADMQRIRQVLINLVSNAVKYNRTGGDVWLTYTDRPDGWRRISVADNGPGIPIEKQDRLFKPFERLGAESSDIEGTGLGLALSKRLVELMGGEIGVESTEGKGSTFWVDLPLSEHPFHRIEAQSDEKPLADIKEYTHTILYIEDNLANYELVQQVLTEGSLVNLIWAIQGSIGLDLARQYLPDLILLDLHLPDTHGSEVLARLRQDEATAAIPVIVISADATPRQIERLRDAGADGYLTKPLNVAEFLRTVQTLLTGG